MNRLRNYYYEHTLIDFHVLLVVAAFALWLVSKFTRDQAYSRAGIAVLGFAVISSIIHENLRRLHLYMKGSTGVSYLPADRIHRMNGIFICFYTIITAIFMILVPKSFLSGIFHRIMGYLKHLVSILLQKIFGANAGLGGGVIAPHDINYSGADGQSTDGGFLRMLAELLQDVMKVAAVLLLIYLAARILIALCRKIMERGNTSNVDDYQFIEVSETRERIRNNSVFARNAEAGISQDAGIRRQYRRTVRRYLSQKDNRLRLLRSQRRSLNETFRNLTPQEIEQYAGIPQSDARTELHTQYEEARYSRKGSV